MSQINNSTVKLILMHEKIWRTFAQILSNRNDLVDVIKPFFVNLNGQNINDEKYILQTFTKEQLECLNQNRIIKKGKFYSLMPNIESQNQLFPLTLEKIIEDDNSNELPKFIQQFKTFNTIITRPFKEVEKMNIPIIQYCIMKKAIKCFKYLLVNGYDDPNLFMEEDDDENSEQIKSFKRYRWNCMATATYFGNKEMIKILEEKGFKKEINPRIIEAAILSYRDFITEEIDELNEKNSKIHAFLDFGILASGKNNNIKGAELLIQNGANINTHDTKSNSIKRIKHYFILQQRIIQKRYLK